MKRLRTKRLVGLSLLLTALLLSVPIGYLGGNHAPEWCFGVGAPLGWIGYALLWERSLSLLAIGGGFLASCIVAILGMWIGQLIVGHFLRDLLFVLPFPAMALHLHMRTGQARTSAPPSAAASPDSLVGILKTIVFVAIGLGIMVLGQSGRLLDTYPRYWGALVGFSLGYIVYRLLRPGAPTPYYVLLCIATPLGSTGGVLANRYLDSSGPIDHSAKVLGYNKPSRGRPICTVPSWRGSWSEQLQLAHVPCPVNGAIIVRTRAGVFGWPWIESIRVDPASRLVAPGSNNT